MIIRNVLHYKSQLIISQKQTQFFQLQKVHFLCHVFFKRVSFILILTTAMTLSPLIIRILDMLIMYNTVDVNILTLDDLFLLRYMVVVKERQCNNIVKYIFAKQKLQWKKRHFVI